MAGVESQGEGAGPGAGLRPRGGQLKAPAPESWCWGAGGRLRVREATVPLGDPTVLAGVGLFETLGVADGRPLDLGEHLERLEAGADFLEISRPDRARLEGAIEQACQGLTGLRGWVKVVLTGAGAWYVFSSPVDPDEIGQPVCAVVLPWRRSRLNPLVGIKSLNYAANRLGLRAAALRGADEGLWLNCRGHLAEGCASNVFLVQRRCLYTPSTADGILPGIVRGQVLEAARGLGLRVQIGKVRLRRLERAAEAFVSSSVRGVRPLLSCDGRDIGDGRPGPWTRRIAAEVGRIRGVLDP